MVISKLQIAKQYAANMIQKLWRRQKNGSGKKSLGNKLIITQKGNIF